MIIEKFLINQCSPTLASLKTASLFTVQSCDRAELEREVEYWNSKFRDKSLELYILKYKNNTALVYLCRKSQLAEDFAKRGVAKFLTRYGYENTDTDYAIGVLKEKLEAYDEFPHEIGLFLGYPLGDVAGFIANAGKNCKCCGCWKVYCNECEAVRSFYKFKKCKDVYTRLWREGRSVEQLTVVA